MDAKAAAAAALAKKQQKYQASGQVNNKTNLAAQIKAEKEKRGVKKDKKHGTEKLY